MKTKIFTAIGLAFIFTGSMMGDSQKATPCLICIAIGCVVLFLTVKTAKSE